MAVEIQNPLLNPFLQDPIFREGVRRGRIEKDIETLTGKKDKDIMDAAARLIADLKDKNPELKKELGVVREMAAKNLLIKEVDKENPKVSRFPESTAEEYAGKYGEAVGNAINELEKLKKKRTMNDAELQKKLQEALL